MGYVSKDFLSTQFTNFATRIATVFAKKEELPAKVSDLTNDSGFITSSVDNLVNYYKKSETYTRDEVASLIASISTMSFRTVDALPISDIYTTTIYLVPKETSETENVYVEYIYVDGSWEIIGETSTNLDGYVTDEELTTALTDYIKVTDVETSNIDFSTYFAS